MSDIIKYLSNIKQARKNLLDAIDAEFEKIPQNSDIQMISETPRVFTINSSQLAKDIWDPTYYDYEEQKHQLQKIVRSPHSIETIINQLRTIADTGKLQDVRYSDFVRKCVKTIVQEFDSVA